MRPYGQQKRKNRVVICTCRGCVRIVSVYTLCVVSCGRPRPLSHSGSIPGPFGGDARHSRCSTSGSPVVRSVWGAGLAGGLSLSRPVLH